MRFCFIHEKEILLQSKNNRATMYEFTIIVPVYNEEDNLERVEKELLAYTKIASKKTAILFVNDGSKDNTVAILNEYASLDKRIKVIAKNENQIINYIELYRQFLFLKKKLQ